MVSIIATTAMGRSMCGSSMCQKSATGPAPSMRAASRSSGLRDCKAGSRISTANGVHSQATITTMAISGMDAKKSTVPSPSERVIQANMPNTGFMSMFFQIRALTVGIMKNGAITSRRQMLRPGNSRSSSAANRVPSASVIASTSPTSSSVLPMATHSARPVSR